MSRSYSFNYREQLLTSTRYGKKQEFRADFFAGCGDFEVSVDPEIGGMSRGAIPFEEVFLGHLTLRDRSPTVGR